MSSCAIKNAYLDDSGEYWCEGKGGKKSNSVNITVTGTFALAAFQTSPGVPHVLHVLDLSLPQHSWFKWSTLCEVLKLLENKLIIKISCVGAGRPYLDLVLTSVTVIETVVDSQDIMLVTPVPVMHLQIHILSSIISNKLLYMYFSGDIVNCSMRVCWTLFNLFTLVFSLAYVWSDHPKCMLIPGLNRLGEI